MPKFSRRQRQLIGAIILIAFVVLYALIASALAESNPVRQSPDWLRPFIYAILGLAWVLPMLPLVGWMQRPDRPQVSKPGLSHKP